MKVSVDPAAQSDAHFKSTIESVTGCFSTQQAIHLRKMASQVDYGCILEVGSYRGKSAVALWTGAKQRSLGTEPAVYCVEPHATFQGIYGGEFGPKDRKQFYENMIATGAYEGVALLNQSSEVIAPGWNRPIGLLLIDGDHTYEGVRRDFDAWDRHVVAGGRVIFDDAADPEIGPYHLVREIIATGRYSLESEMTKLVTLRKNYVDQAPAPFNRKQPLRMLVVCDRLIARGGYFRFESLAEALRSEGHQFTFATLANEQHPSWNGNVPVINIEATFSRQWDVTIVPGRAGFVSKDRRRILNAFRSENFGLRVQHILNDKQLRDDFKVVNHAFRPHLVLFNNHHWQPGDYTQFQANQFKTIVGGVDLGTYSKVKYRPFPKKAEKVWLGAQSQKNPEVLISILDRLPERFGLRVFGPKQKLSELGESHLKQGRLELVGVVRGNQLRDFYDSIDLVLSVESSAGWANVGAEALAAGKPLICTRPGTVSFAQHRETAFVVDKLDPGAFVNGILELCDDSSLIEKLRFNGRNRIAAFEWARYGKQTIETLHGARKSEYYHAPAHELFGKWPLETRLSGLEEILSTCEGKTVLDLGAAEGAIAHQLLNAGAETLHGFELDQNRVENAKRLCGAYSDRCEFRVANLDHWNEFRQKNHDILLHQYDVVAYLGIHHHLNPATRNENLAAVCGMAKDHLLLRTPEETFVDDALDKAMQVNGFQSVTESQDDARTSAGGIRIYKRVRHACHLISFPKSGRTWLRYALHQLGVLDSVHFHHDGFEFNNQQPTVHDFSLIDRIEKFDPASSRVIYLERNPLDVMASFYHQITGRFKDYHDFQGTPSEFIRDPYFGANVLQRFRSLWSRLATQNHVKKVTYESCHEDFSNVLEQIVSHFGLDVSKSEIQLATKAASFDAMKCVEAEGAFPYPWLRPRNGSAKVREGKVNGHREFFSSNDLKFLAEVFELAKSDASP